MQCGPVTDRQLIVAVLKYLRQYAQQRGEAAWDGYADSKKIPRG